MKKFSINILCIIVIALLCGNVLTSLWEMKYHFSSGYSDGYELAESQEATFCAVPVTLSHKERYAHFSPLDTLSQSDCHMALIRPVVGSAIVYSDRAPMSVGIPVLVLSLVSLVFLVMTVIAFVRFVVNINKGNIFVKTNVKYLTRFGIYILIVAGLQVVMGVIMDVYLISYPVVFEGHNLHAFWEIPWTKLIVGFIALAIAEIWKKGIDMEEESSLTV